MKKTLFAGSIALALAFIGTGAMAQTTYNSNPTPGWIFGTGNNSLNNTAVDIENGVELALRPHERFQAPTTSVGNTYSFALGQDLGIDFEVYAQNFSSLGLTPTLTIFDVGNNNTVSGNPGLFADDTAINGTNGFQNSEPLSFLDFPFYNKNANDTFVITLATTGGSAGPQSLVINAIQGAGASVGGVPEPASWALMILGFGGVGAALRRRNFAFA